MDAVGWTLLTEGLADKEIFLHLSDLSQPTHSFEKFITELDAMDKGRKQRENDEKDDKRRSHNMGAVASTSQSEDQQVSGLSFEDTLLYLRLPDFRRVVSHSKEQRAAVAYLFNWLSSQDVRTIIECIIPDSLLCPLDDDFVSANLFEKFSIERLDWRKLDLNLDLLLRLNGRPSQRLEEIKLYASGNWGIMFYWASVDGIPQLFLRGLKKASISFVQPRCSEAHDLASFGKRVKDYTQKFRKMIDESQVSLQKDERLSTEQKAVINAGEIPWSKQIEVRSESFKWNFFTALNTVTSKDTSNLGIFDDFRACNAFLNKIKSFGDEPKNERRKSYSKFIQDAIKVVKEPIKIAIIDNGTDTLRSTIADNIADGISFIKDEDGLRLPWWTVSDPHGTQMASLIQQVNPHCSLYPIRVGKERNDIKDEDARKAVKWAINQKVDIISMSWTTETRDAKLRGLLQDAAKQSMVFCACDDKGVREHTLSKALSGELIRIGAANSVYRARLVSDKTADFMVDGEEILADGPKYMESQVKKNITGSSVATALAAGIASLALVLFKIANITELANDPFLAKNLMTKNFCVKLFQNMVHKRDDEKVLDPTLVFANSGFDDVRADTQTPPAALKSLHISKVDPGYCNPQDVHQRQDDDTSGSEQEYYD